MLEPSAMYVIQRQQNQGIMLQMNTIHFPSNALPFHLSSLKSGIQSGNKPMHWSKTPYRFHVNRKPIKGVLWKTLMLVHSFHSLGLHKRWDKNFLIPKSTGSKSCPSDSLILNKFQKRRRKLSSRDVNKARGVKAKATDPRPRPRMRK